MAKIPVLIVGAALEGIAGTVRWLGGLRAADLRVPTPGLVFILLTAVAASAWICSIPPRPRIRPAVLEMTAIDVGQGDSILLVSPSGRTLLVDAGGLPR